MQELDATTLDAEWRNILLYGPPGTYKTRFLLTCPKPVWVYDWDWGALSLARDVKPGEIKIIRFGDDPNKTANKISRDQFTPQGTVPLLEFIDHINRIFDMTPEQRPATVALDALGRYGERCMEFALKLNNRQVPVFQDWGQAMSKIRETIEAGCSLPCNFVTIAHDQTDRDELLGQINTLPLTIGKLAGEIGAYFDEVFYAKVLTEKDPKTNVEVSRPVFLTQPDGFVKVAKSRSAKRPKIVDANFVTLYPKRALPPPAAA